MDYPKKPLRSQSGQALIEYILLLSVVVLMILGALYQFNQAVAFWADNYFGNYLSCLIETGELPNLNGTGGTSSTCDQISQPFSLTNGNALVGGDIGSGAGGGGISNQQPSGPTYGGKGSGNGNLTMMPVSGSSSGSSGSPSRFAAPNLRRGGGGSGKDALGGDAITDISGYEQDRIVRIPLRHRDGILGSRYQNPEEKEKEQTKVTETAATAQAKARDELMPIRRRVASNEKPPEIEEFTFSNLLRYLIIAAIILAILIFIGGQIMQISKSME